MTPHDELELLSSYLDGELDARERDRVETHTATCANCRATLDGLKATLADLRTLPEPEPAPQDSWALRAAIRRARSPMRKWQRLSWAAGAVAAAAIAFVAVTLPGGGPSAVREATDSLAGGPEAAAVPLYQSAENLTAADLQARLLDVAGIVPGGGAAAPAAGKGTPGEDSIVSSVVPQSRSQFSPYAGTDPSVRAEIDACVAVVRGSTQEFLQPVRYEVATFEGKKAFLLFFRTTGRYELWVVDRSDCDTVLYFGQAGG